MTFSVFKGVGPVQDYCGGVLFHVSMLWMGAAFQDAGLVPYVKMLGSFQH